ncbi:hypothetical protein AHMF7616_02238 [Adhaeribacter pallidiroseus]|uniref:Uncharacterized protein n=1 Tax=Adhaeribacter pallidiroseus TaxID=2072847 RepID=A0A369QFE6_9BACT|nr:hypothetical protein AHMF7616_02238 [Adhaeribacter pallidiroseus]
MKLYYLLINEVGKINAELTGNNGGKIYLLKNLKTPAIKPVSA